MIISSSTNLICAFFSMCVMLQCKCLLKKYFEAGVWTSKKNSFMQKQGNCLNNNVCISNRHIPDMKKNPLTGTVLE